MPLERKSTSLRVAAKQAAVHLPSSVFHPPCYPPAAIDSSFAYFYHPLALMEVLTHGE